jgi:hypothetical protein
MTDDDKALVGQLRDEADTWGEPKHADEIDMRGKLHTAADRIEAQAAEIERLRIEAEARYDRGYYDGSTNPIVRHDALKAENEQLREHLISALDTLKDAEICNDECSPCNEARAALEQSK